MLFPGDSATQMEEDNAAGVIVSLDLAIYWMTGTTVFTRAHTVVYMWTTTVLGLVLAHSGNLSFGIPFVCREDD